MRIGSGSKYHHTHGLEAASLLDGLSLKVGSLPERRSLLQGDECLVAVGAVVTTIVGVEDAGRIEAESILGVAHARHEAIIGAAGKEGAEDVDLVLGGRWGCGASWHCVGD